MKKFFGSIAVGFLLVGCGGVEVDDTASNDPSSLVKVEQGICEGWGAGAVNCTAECNDGVNAWYYVGTYPNIPYGGCDSAAESFCRYYFGAGHNGACWSY